jgi:hypothetical protein
VRHKPTIGEIIWGTGWRWGLFALVHSLLASRQAKNWVRRTAGARYRDGLYRFGFVNLGAGWTLWLLLRTRRLPDRDLFQVPPPWSWAMRMGQLSCLVLALLAGRVVGVPDFGGLPQLAAFLHGQDPPPEPGAQGPPRAADGAMKVAGPFRFTRHPANLALLLFVLFPRITVKGLTVGALALIYMVLGSIHEETRLLARFGAAYTRYQQQVPFLLSPASFRAPAPENPAPANTAESATPEQAMRQQSPGIAAEESSPASFA